MGEQTRKTLREFFKAGQLPTEEHFGDLIDSMLNMKDEGFRKSPGNGLEVAAAAGQDALFSCYRDRDPGLALWSACYGKQNNQLLFREGAAQPQGDAQDTPAVLCLDVAHPPPGEGQAPHRHPRVGINTDLPRHTLDVAGVLASQGRIGSFAQTDLDRPAAVGAGSLQSVPADGLWHPLVDQLQGCHAFEVVAGAGGPSGSGRYALLHAVALNTHNPLVGWLDWLNPRRGIRATSAHYGSRCDQLQLRWAGGHGKGAAYRLEIRSRCAYDDAAAIRFGITRLWFDPAMAGSQPASK